MSLTQKIGHNSQTNLCPKIFIFSHKIFGKIASCQILAFRFFLATYETVAGMGTRGILLFCCIRIWQKRKLPRNAKNLLFFLSQFSDEFGAVDSVFQVCGDPIVAGGYSY